MVPAQFELGTIPSAIVDDSYPSFPLGNLTWEINQNQTHFEATPPGYFTQNRQVGLDSWTSPGTGLFIGIEITLLLYDVGFGVPVHLLNGSEETLPASFPANWIWNTTGQSAFFGQVTYFIPATTGEGTWKMYLAGGNDSLSTGGFLFQQLTWTNDSYPY